MGRGVKVGEGRVWRSEEERGDEDASGLVSRCDGAGAWLARECVAGITCRFEAASTAGFSGGQRSARPVTGASRGRRPSARKRRASPFPARSGPTKARRLGRIGESIINPGLRSAVESARRPGRGRPKVHFIVLIRGTTLFCLRPSAPELLLFAPQAPIRIPQKSFLPLQRFEPLDVLASDILAPERGRRQLHFRHLPPRHDPPPSVNYWLRVPPEHERCQGQRRRRCPCTMHTSQFQGLLPQLRPSVLMPPRR